MPWGAHQSLYVELNSAERDSLEIALSLAYRGLYDEAEEIYKSEPLSSSPYPVVQLEMALMYDAMGLERDTSNVLKSCHVPDDRLDPARGADIWDLIMLKRVSSDILRLGKLPLANPLFRVVERLALKRPDEYTDTEAHCAVVCWQILALSRSQSNILMSKEIPLNFPRPSQIRMALQEAGEFEVAQAYLTYEASLSSSKGVSIVDHYREFLAAVSKDRAALDKMNPLKIAETRLFFAEGLARCNMDTEARGELTTASSLIAECAFASPRLRLKHNSVQLQLIRILTDDCLSQSCELSKQYLAMRHFASCSKQQIRSYEIARELKASKEDSSLMQAQRRVKEIQSLIMSAITLGEQHTCSAHSLASWLITYGSELAGPDVGAYGATFLQLMSKFKTQFPEFGLPVFGHTLATFATKAAMDLGNFDAALQHIVERTRLAPLCPGNLSNENKLCDVPDDRAMRHWDTNDPDSNDFLEFLKRRCTSLLLDWVRRDYEAGTILDDDVRELLKLGDQESDGVTDESTQRSCSRSMHDLQIQDLLVAVFGGITPISEDCWTAWLNSLDRWVHISGGLPSFMQRQLLLSQTQVARILTLTEYEPVDSSDHSKRNRTVRRETARSLDIYGRVDRRISEGGSLEKARWIHANGLLCMAIDGDTNSDDAVTDQDLATAIDIVVADAAHQEAEGKTRDAYNGRALVARMIWQRYARFGRVKPWDCLSQWANVHKLHQALRTDHYLLPAHGAFVAKDRLNSILHQSEKFKEALRASITSLIVFHSASSENQLEWGGKSMCVHLLGGLTTWIQRSKARALTDLLGQSMDIPRSAAQFFHDEPKAGALWEECTGLLRLANSASMKELAQVRGEFQRLTGTLRTEYPSFQPFLDIHSGEAISASELLSLGQRLGPSVNLVEWVHVIGFKNDILMVVYQNGALSRFKIISDITMAKVNEWVNTNLAVGDDTEAPDVVLNYPEAKEDLNVLRPLIAPLDEFTEPGMTLVLCPTLSLHRIPLHAISLGKPARPLIERNPIVYIQSLSLLRLCEASFQPVPSKDDSCLVATVLNTLNEFNSAEEERETNDSIAKICEILQAQTFSQAARRKEVFRDRALVSNILHVHGHAEFEQMGQKVRQSLLLREPCLSEADKLSVEDIFNLKFRKPSLMLAMGCNTGRATVSQADDLLGLTAAFHVAGAGAVISTLWKIDRGDCMRFSKHFYKTVMASLNECSGDGKTTSEFVNLAVAFQSAVCALRREEGSKKIRRPYHWAGLVLHGAWLFPRLSLK